MRRSMKQELDTRLSTELNVRPDQVRAAVQLLDEGATVPFIARYRKEVTMGLDDTQLRNLEERLRYLRELDERRDAIESSISEQKKLTPELRAALGAATTKAELEDLYRPYKKRRRTKAQVAREAGLEPLAQNLFANPDIDPVLEATKFLAPDEGVADAEAALEGAQQILMEEWSEHPPLVRELRKEVRREAKVKSIVVRGKKEEGARFQDWFDFDEPLASMPSHRALALLRGRKEGVLRVNLAVGDELESISADPKQAFTGRVVKQFGISDKGRPGDRFLLDSAEKCWKVKLSTHLETELMVELRERAEQGAVEVFASNLRDLLLAAPAGPKTILGLDPGLRTGVKVAVVDHTGKVLATDTIYPHAPRKDWDGAVKKLASIAKKHGVQLVSIGNGTASRETDRLVSDLMSNHKNLGLQKVVVSEAGASVYSASELAANEFPDMDVTLRGAVSIARRLQDPLAELVKIDPKSIGVGQYQHDVNQSVLGRSLEAVVEDCVNAVGVDVNSASAALLERVAGLNPTLAKNVVAWRDENGAFENRKQLLKVPRLGPKAFEQCAGFLRIRDGKEPLDASAVHPEAYPLVQKMAKVTKKPVKDMIGDRTSLKQIEAETFTDKRFGLPTVKDILAELEKPGRDPRPAFQTATFAEGVEEISDLKAGMQLEGVVTNVTDFGAFVDLGVHQDGLVHISQLADRFIENAREVVKAGDIVRVRVVEVDLPRKRIALTMRKGTPEPSGSPKSNAGASKRGKQRGDSKRGSIDLPPEPKIESPLAAQLRKLKKPGKS